MYASHYLKNTIIRNEVVEYPFELVISFRHNHSIKSADALRYRTVSPNVKDKFLTLFAQYFTPSAALAHYKEELRSSLKTSD